MPRAVTEAEFQETFSVVETGSPYGFSTDAKARARDRWEPLRIPADAGRMAILAAFIASQVQSDTLGILTLNRSVWPSNQVPSLYERVRRSEGIEASLVECPGDVFDADDESYAHCLVAVALYSFWDFAVVTRNGTCDLFISHDEYLDPVRLADESIYKALRLRLK